MPQEGHFPTKTQKSNPRKKRGNKVRRQAGRQAGQGRTGRGRQGQGQGRQAPRQAGRHHPFSHLFVAITPFRAFSRQIAQLAPRTTTRPSSRPTDDKSAPGRQAAPRMTSRPRQHYPFSHLFAAITPFRTFSRQIAQLAPRTTTRPSSRPSDDKSPLGRQVAPRNGGARAACMAS